MYLQTLYHILILLSLNFWIGTVECQEDSARGIRHCPPLPVYRNVETTCFFGTTKVNCRTARVGTILRYKCKPNHVPLDADDKTNDGGSSNELRCDTSEKWLGVKQYDSYRCKEDCGKITTNARPLVIHGIPSNRTQWPWHASIFRNVESSWAYICGGSIIRNQIILSAAHCFAIDHHRVRSPEEFRIILGAVSSNYIENLNADGIQLHRVQRIQISENYDPKGGYLADIAIVQLKDNIVFNENVVPVCLPNDFSTDVNALKPGSIARVAGFGITEDGKISKTLRSLDLKIKSNAECYSSLQRTLSESQFCGGEKHGGTRRWETVCNGDSGGGLCISSKVHEKFYIHGIVSSGDPDTDGGICKNYAVFTRIYQFYFWIRDIIEEITGEIARDLHQNVPYPYAVRGTETQFTAFTGLPREWINRLTSLEVIYAEISSESILEALENAKPIDTISLKNIILRNGRLFKHHVVLPFLSAFTLDIIQIDGIGKIGETRIFPIPITEEYFKSLLFFDKDFESSDNWMAESLIQMDTNIELIVHIFRLLRLNIANGELTLQQTKLADKILAGRFENVDFTLRILALHRSQLDFNRLGLIPTLTELVLDKVRPTQPIHVDSWSAATFRNLSDLKYLVLNPALNTNKNKLKIDIATLPIGLTHLALSNTIHFIGAKFENLKFQHLKTFCCLDCLLQNSIWYNLQLLFPKISAIVIKSAITKKSNPTLQNAQHLRTFYNTTGGGVIQDAHVWTRQPGTNRWFHRLLNEHEYKLVVYNCTGQSRFWTSTEEYLALRRLKSFEKAAYNTGVYAFRGNALPHALEEFQGIPQAIQANLKRIHLTTVDLTPQIIKESVSHCPKLEYLTLTNVTFDISGHHYKLIQNESREFKLESFMFKDWTFHYILETVDGQFDGIIIPFQHIGRFQIGNASNILQHVFQTLSSIRLTKDDCISYLLDVSLEEVRRFYGFLFKVISFLPEGHILRDMYDLVKERFSTVKDGILPPSWKFSGLHVIRQEFIKGFFKDDFLRLIAKTGVLDILLTRLGRFVTVERSTSLSLLKKEQNPLNFPILYAIAVNINEDKIE